MFLQYFDAVGWVLRPVKNRRPYNLYCVGGDVKPCSINQSTSNFVLSPSPISFDKLTFKVENVLFSHPSLI